VLCPTHLAQAFFEFSTSDSKPLTKPVLHSCGKRMSQNLQRGVLQT